MVSLAYLKANVPVAVLSAKDPAAIAAAAPGIVVSKKTAIGNGTILSVLGVDAGNAFLDAIDTAPTYRHVKDIVARDSFDMGLDVSKAGVQAMVPSIITQDQANLLIALGEDVVQVSEYDVRCALWDAARNWLGG